MRQSGNWVLSRLLPWRPTFEITHRHRTRVRFHRVLSQSWVFRAKSKNWDHKFNDLQDSKFIKNKLCDTTFLTPANRENEQRRRKHDSALPCPTDNPSYQLRHFQGQNRHSSKNAFRCARSPSLACGTSSLPRHPSRRNARVIQNV